MSDFLKEYLMFHQREKVPLQDCVKRFKLDWDMLLSHLERKIVFQKIAANHSDYGMSINNTVKNINKEVDASPTCAYL